MRIRFQTNLDEAKRWMDKIRWTLPMPPRVGEKIVFGFDKTEIGPSGQPWTYRACWQLRVVDVSYAANPYGEGATDAIVELHTPHGESVRDWSEFYRRHVEGREP